MIRFIVFCFLASISFISPASANFVTTPRTEVTLLSEVKAIHAGQKFWVVLSIKLQPGWHTYWKNPGDSGIPPALTWTLPNGFSAGEIQYLAPDREKVGPLIDYAYDNNAYYLIPITPPSILRENTTSILAAKARLLVCKDVCIPESGDLSLVLPATAKATPEPSTDAALVADLVSKLPLPIVGKLGFDRKDGQVEFSVKIKDIPSPQAISSTVKSALFYPATEGFVANAAQQQVKIMPDKLEFTIKQDDGKAVDTADGVLSLFLQGGERRDYDIHLQSGLVSPDAVGATSEGLLGLPAILAAMVFAFLGGLVLNLMPCVFPVLSLKALAVAKKSAAHPDEVRIQGIAYAVGVIASFLLLATVLIVIRAGGEAVGWGYQMQSPVFVASLAVLLFVVGLNLSGYFELPVLFGNLGGETTSKRNALGSFTTGVLAVMVATPCTAPFMAPAVGFALAAGTPTILAVFISLGLGFSMPFLIISLYPRLISALPKPGAWMDVFKQFLAFPMYLTVVWLLWVLTREAGPDAGCIALISIVLVAFALWLWHRDSSIARLIGLIVAVGGLAFTTAMIHSVPAMQNTLRSQAEPFTVTKLEELRKQGKPVFVDATADWCITCKVNETVALSSPEIMQAFEMKHVTYMVADWTHGDMDITRYLQSFGRSGVPLYVYYPPQQGAPVVLPQILTESTVLETIQ